MGHTEVVLRVRIRTLPTVLTFAIASTAVPASAGCPPMPREAQLCRALGQTSLRSHASGAFVWRAAHGESTSVEEFVDPDTAYQLCAWDEEKLVIAADIPAATECTDGSCWSERDDDAWRYDDEAGANGDIRRLDFTASDEARTKIRAEVLVIGGIVLPVIGDIIVQMLRTDTGLCLESVAPADSHTISDKHAFAAAFDVEDSARDK
jgi:hypothetical protein